MMLCSAKLSALAVLIAFWFPPSAGGARGLKGSRSSQPVPVDFYVFTGTDGEETGVAPRCSMNIGGDDKTTGFYALCKDKCPTWTEQREDYTSPQMRFCRCVAELLAEDLSSHFAVLAPNEAAAFTMGTYTELDAGQEYFMIENGHGTLHTLMDNGENVKHHRKTGRLTVWVANDIDGHSQGTMLAGTTYLDQPLYASGPGAGVLLHGGISRVEKRLSHEVGHVVGFHHVAGPKVQYTYEHKTCPADCQKVQWEMSEGPNCEVNIMGSWYDGPYCCPWENLLQLHTATAGNGLEAALARRTALAYGHAWANVSSSVASVGASEKCLPNSQTSPKSPFCCGEGCTHKCPEEMPDMTFATAEHEDELAKIFKCWLHLRGTPNPAKAALIKLHEYGRSPGAGVVQRPIVCVDYDDAPGPCQ